MSTERRRHRHPAGRSVRRGLRLALLVVMAVVVGFPIYITVVNALLTSPQIAARPPVLFPTHPQWSTFATAFSEAHMGIYLRNSAIVTVLITGAQLGTSILAGYAFAFVRFPFRRTIFMICLATLMVPMEATIIPNYQTIEAFGWFNTFPALVVPFVATGLGAFLFRQAFRGLPRDLRDAATLDGYGHLRFLTRVVLPLNRPVIAAFGIFAFLGAWNQYLWPLVSTGGSTPLYTVQIGLKALLGTEVSQIPVSLAGAVIAFVPLAILLLIFQKQLVRSLTGGAVK
jgi:sn-glycerol 3-phosphate transport system permease protein